MSSWWVFRPPQNPNQSAPPRQDHRRDIGSIMRRGDMDEENGQTMVRTTQRSVLRQRHVGGLGPRTRLDETAFSKAITGGGALRSTGAIDG